MSHQNGEPSPNHADNWDYKPLKGRVASTGYSLAAIGALSFSLVSVFNPVAIGIVAGYAGLGVLMSRVLAKKSLRKAFLKESEKKGSVIRVPQNARLYTTVNDLSGKMGLQKTPDVFLVNKKMLVGIASKSVPVPFRWLLKKQIAKQVGRKMHKFFGAISTANILITTKEAQQGGHWTEKEERFIAAHELAHVKCDDSNDLHTTAKVGLGRAARFAMWSLIGLGAMGLFFSGAPTVLAAGTGFWTALGYLAGGGIIAKLCLSAASRVTERRADRNALHITRDYNNAAGVMVKLHEDRKSEKFPQKLLLSHPTYEDRSLSLYKSWQQMGTQPPGNNNAHWNPKGPPPSRP